MWQKITQADVVRGRIIRLGSMDGAYNMATILSIKDNNVTIARPMAYANEHFDTKQPYLYSEVFSITMERMCAANTDIEVYVGGSLLKI